jgi:hypothetical protein
VFGWFGDLTSLGGDGLGVAGDLPCLVGVLAGQLVGVLFSDAGEQVGLSGQQLGSGGRVGRGGEAERPDVVKQVGDLADGDGLVGHGGLRRPVRCYVRLRLVVRSR